MAHLPWASCYNDSLHGLRAACRTRFAVKKHEKAKNFAFFVSFAVLSRQKTRFLAATWSTPPPHTHTQLIVQNAHGIKWQSSWSLLLTKLTTPSSSKTTMSKKEGSLGPIFIHTTILETIETQKSSSPQKTCIFDEKLIFFFCAS